MNRRLAILSVLLRYPDAALRAGQSALSFAVEQLREKLPEAELRSEADRHEQAGDHDEWPDGGVELGQLLAFS